MVETGSWKKCTNNASKEYWKLQVAASVPCKAADGEKLTENIQMCSWDDRIYGNGRAIGFIWVPIGKMLLSGTIVSGKPIESCESSAKTTVCYLGNLERIHSSEQLTRHSYHQCCGSFLSSELCLVINPKNHQLSRYKQAQRKDDDKQSWPQRKRVLSWVSKRIVHELTGNKIENKPRMSYAVQARLNFPKICSKGHQCRNRCSHLHGM